MGWYYETNSTRKSIINELTSSGITRKLIKSCYRGNPFSGVLWTVWESKPDMITVQEADRWIGCDLLQYDRALPGWGYKPMEESMGPYFYSCPLGYLEIVPHNTNPKWREGVKEYHARRRKPLTSTLETATL